MGIHSIELMDEGMILMDGPDMVYHTVGVVTTEAGKPQYVPITQLEENGIIHMEVWILFLIKVRESGFLLP